MLAEFHIIRPAGSARNAADRRGASAGPEERPPTFRRGRPAARPNVFNGAAPHTNPANGSCGAPTRSNHGARAALVARPIQANLGRVARIFGGSAFLTHAVCALYAGSIVPSHWPAILLMTALFFIAPCIACAIAVIEEGL